LMSGLQKRLDSHVNMVDTIGPFAERQAAQLHELPGEAAS
jgi:hypothetical protein